jgi:hypothetical protein
MARKEAKKPSTWAEEAGKYYRKNVGKNGIESFTDVLKSSDFKKQYYAKNSMKRGGEGEAASVAAPAPATAVGPAPANTTAVEIQVPLNSVTGVMKTGGMKKKSKSMKMKKKGKMTKKRSLKNNKKRRITKKYMGGTNYEIDDAEDVKCFAQITPNSAITDNTNSNTYPEPLTEFEHVYNDNENENKEKNSKLNLYRKPPSKYRSSLEVVNNSEDDKSQLKNFPSTTNEAI